MTKRTLAYRPCVIPKQGRIVVGAKWWLMMLWAIPALSMAQDCPDEVDVLQPITCSGADDGVLSVSVPDGVESSEIYCPCLVGIAY